MTNSDTPKLLPFLLLIAIISSAASVYLASDINASEILTGLISGTSCYLIAVLAMRTGWSLLIILGLVTFSITSMLPLRYMGVDPSENNWPEYKASLFGLTWLFFLMTTTYRYIRKRPRNEESAQKSNHKRDS